MMQSKFFLTYIIVLRSFNNKLNPHIHIFKKSYYMVETTNVNLEKFIIIIIIIICHELGLDRPVSA